MSANSLTIRRYVDDRVLFSHSDGDLWQGFYCKTPCLIEMDNGKKDLIITTLEGVLIKKFDFEEIFEIIDDTGMVYTPVDIDTALQVILEHILKI